MVYRHRCFFAGETSPVEFEILDTAGQVIIMFACFLYRVIVVIIR